MANIVLDELMVIADSLTSRQCVGVLKTTEEAEEEAVFRSRWSRCTLSVAFRVRMWQWKLLNEAPIAGTVLKKPAVSRSHRSKSVANGTQGRHAERHLGSSLVCSVSAGRYGQRYVGVR